MLDFNGTTDFITCGKDSSINNIFSNGGTIMAWILPYGYGGNSLGRILDKSSDIFASDGWVLYVTDGGDAMVFTHGASTSSGTWATNSNTILLDTFYHIAITYNKDDVANNALIYINGVSVNVNTSSPVGTLDDDSGQDLFIGSNNLTTRTFDGLIGDARCYDRILDPKEIYTIYNTRGHDGIVDSLVGRWVMNEGYPGSTYSSGGAERIDSWSGEILYETNGFTYSPPTGTDRLTLVMITTESNTNPVVSISSVTLGGKELTGIESSVGLVAGAAGGFHNLLFVGYLKDEEIEDMSGNTLTINWTQAPNNIYGETMVSAATYQHVDQDTPISDSSSNTSSSGNSIQAGDVVVCDCDRHLYFAMNGQPVGHTAPAGYTEQLEQRGGVNAHADASVERGGVSSGTFNPTASWAGTSRLAIISAVVNCFGASANFITDYSNSDNDGETSEPIVYAEDRINLRKRMI